MEAGGQDPDAPQDSAEKPGGVSLTSSRIRLIPLSTAQQRGIRSLDINDALLQADTIKREVYERAQSEWDSSNSEGVWGFVAPEYGLNDAPATFLRYNSFVPLLFGICLRGHESLLRYNLTLDCIIFERRTNVRWVETSGRGEPGVVERVCAHLPRRFRTSRAQEDAYLDVRMEFVRTQEPLRTSCN